MQRVTLVRYTAKPDCADENEALSRKVFAELRRVRPTGVAYALFRNGDEFLHLFINFENDSSDLVTELPTFKAFSAASASRMVEPPQPLRIATALVENYGFEAAAVKV